MNENCVVFKWNPGISSYSFTDFEIAIANEEYDSDWSIFDHEKVKTGDRFFMLKVGCGTCGIVAAGVITSDPKPGRDWSGKGRKVWYSDYRSEFMVNPATLPIIESTALEDNIPGFDWYGGHSGVVLEEDSAAVLEKLYLTYLRKNIPIFTKRLNLIRERNSYNDQLYINEKLLTQIKGE